MSATSNWPVTLDDVTAAAKRIRAFLPPTPLRGYSQLDRELGCHVLVKHENHQPTNAFKARNGLAVLTALDDHERRRGVVAASRGNHGLGLAHAGVLLGVDVTICVPEGNNPEKNQAMLDLGVDLVVEGRDYDESVAVMDRLVAERGLRPVHSTNEPLVSAGAGTITLELLEQAEDQGERLDILVLAVGGGSQAVGAMTVVGQLRPEVEVHAVQAAAAPAIHDSWHAGRPLTTSTADTFADGVATRMSYPATFSALRQGLAGFVVVSEDEIAAAIRLYLRATHNLAEGAGALGLAGVKKMSAGLQGKTVGVVLSGSNIDQITLGRVINREL